MSNSSNGHLPREKIYDLSTKSEVETYYNGENDVKELDNVLASKNSSAQVCFHGGSAEDLESTVWSMISQNGTVYICMVCGKSKDKTMDKNAKKNK